MVKDLRRNFREWDVLGGVVVRAGGGGHLQLVVVVTGAELQPVEHHDHLTQTGSGDEVAVLMYGRHRSGRVCGCVVRFGSV